MLNDKRIDMSQLVPTSKMALKTSCLRACNNDIERATKLYEYMTADLPDLPDLDPVVPSVMDRVFGGANDVIGWINEHQGEIMQGINLIKSIKAPAATPAPAVPPIPSIKSL